MKQSKSGTPTGQEKGQPNESGESPGVRSVQRAIDILALLTETQPSVSVTDIVKATGLAKTTVIRLVHTLEQNGLLWATSKGYVAGPGLWRWAHLARTSWELPAEAQQLMRDLADRQGETVNLYVLRDTSRVCVAQQESRQPLRHVVRVGDELPLWGGASAKVLLHNAAPALLLRVAEDAPEGSGDVEALESEVAATAERGYAVSHGEREAGLTAVAVPVAGRSGAVVAALTLSGPSVRFPADRIDEFVADLEDTASHMAQRGLDSPFTL